MFDKKVDKFSQDTNMRAIKFTVSWSPEKSKLSFAIRTSVAPGLSSLQTKGSVDAKKIIRLEIMPSGHWSDQTIVIDPIAIVKSS